MSPFLSVYFLLTVMRVPFNLQPFSVAETFRTPTYLRTPDLLDNSNSGSFIFRILSEYELAPNHDVILSFCQNILSKNGHTTTYLKRARAAL